MRLSRSLIPTLKETPAEAQIVSHRLMLRAGLIRQQSAGIYAWLPAGQRVLRNIANIVREEQDRAGAQEILMPTIQAADLWRESGRYDAYGPEMLRIRDRHDREMLYGPTNEEMLTAIMRDSVQSYRDLPQMLYHIQWKFRDEVRPRFGVLRGREFLMKDGYSFDLDYAGAVASYRRMLLAYMRTFRRLGVRAIPMRADTGPIGGDLSHEFHILAPNGESGVFYDNAFETIGLGDDTLSYDNQADLNAFFEQMTSLYAATDEKHDTEAWNNVPAQSRREGRGIEVGQIFYFGTKYSEAMGFSVVGPDGSKIHPEMGSYGIGVSRLTGAIIEASHDDAGIIWPASIAPFRTAILNLRQGDAITDTLCESLHEKLGDAALYDDRPARAGEKFADADLMGHPWQLIVGPRGAANNQVEVKNRRSGERTELSADDALTKVLG
ncbi:proline--tRNA ligase [Acidiphilium sp. AL]|uniref:Proline--tRNA ligase n=1 Tax=Acidiphilium iwatense TaxID=768198 RepID=A0ABS9E0F4_9PROT|nr:MULTISPECIES: proline--tRNA ligase [Acidiphilium]MCF3947069.1 proline--tRNA ligase [Acidiphilium iwatense]MCU4160471.1 proline--tRNA ligase [Acidiphilium sp. AL]